MLHSVEGETYRLSLLGDADPYRRPVTVSYDVAAGGPPVVTRGAGAGGPVHRRCGECAGAGRGTLLVSRRPCLACGGTGIVAAPDDLAGDGGGGTAGTSPRRLWAHERLDARGRVTACRVILLRDG